MSEYSTAVLRRFPGESLYAPSVRTPDQEKLMPFEAAMPEFAAIVGPLVDRIDTAFNNYGEPFIDDTERPMSELPQDVPGYIDENASWFDSPGIVSVDVHRPTFRAQFDKDGKTYEVTALRSRDRQADPEGSKSLVDAELAALLDGSDIPNLARLVAVDREQGIIIKTAPPGKRMYDLPLRTMAGISVKHLAQLSETVRAMREKGLLVKSAKDLSYDKKTGFHFGAYTHPEWRRAPQIDVNTVSFLNWALSDHRSQDAYRWAAESRTPKFDPTTTGLRGLLRAWKLRQAASLPSDGPFQFYYDQVKELAEPGESPTLLEVVRLSESPAPQGAERYVRTSVHVVRRNNGQTGFQVVNEMNDGVSVLPIEVVGNHAYLVLVDQVRYPHQRPGDEHLSVEQAARLGRVGIVSREAISGGVEARDASLEEAAAREANEEAGIRRFVAGSLRRLFKQRLLGSISVNHQPFNFFEARIEPGMFRPQTIHPDAEEGDMRVGAYRFDTLPEMIDSGIISELSTVTAIQALRSSETWGPYFHAGQPKRRRPRTAA